MAVNQDSTTVTGSPVVGKQDVGNGVVIHYQHYQQDSNGLCVVLLHSLAMDHRFWRLVVPEMARKTSVVCIDVRGHGQSSKPEGPYSIPQFAEDAKKVVQALGYDRAIVGGASMGGCISLQFAIDYPELTAAAALIDTTSWYGPTAVQDWELRAEKACTEGFASMVKFQTTRWFSDAFREAQPKLVQDCVDAFLANDVDAYAETCRAMGAFNAFDQAAKVTVPTAVIVGEEDYAAPVDMARHLHESIKGSTLTIIPAARHLTPLETPDVIIEALTDLLARVTAEQA
ncbi:MAG TPA: alpha/beta hydrolase [Burkholderiaceae bacterium]|nr:alpha/beta hydrolase [Burkholderiaceae bacterium]